jgi:transposase-like protein
LSGETLELITVDGGAGLLAALPFVYPAVPVQRCGAHKIRNIVNKLKAADHNAVKRTLHEVMNAQNQVAARSAAGRFARRWQGAYPKAVACLRNDLDELLACFAFTDPTWRKAARTTNAIERRFREVRRRTRPMGVFADRTSIERILFAVFTHENSTQGVPTLFSLTQNI